MHVRLENAPRLVFPPFGGHLGMLFSLALFLQVLLRIAHCLTHLDFDVVVAIIRHRCSDSSFRIPYRFPVLSSRTFLLVHIQQYLLP